MPSEDLVDQLWMRLYQAGVAAGGYKPSPKEATKFWRAVAAEALRQMRWAWLTGSLQGTDVTMSCGYSRERILEDYKIHNDYEHIQAKGDFEARHDADIHLAPPDWTP